MARHKPSSDFHFHRLHTCFDPNLAFSHKSTQACAPVFRDMRRNIRVLLIASLHITFSTHPLLPPPFPNKTPKSALSISFLIYCLHIYNLILMQLKNANAMHVMQHAVSSPHSFLSYTKLSPTPPSPHPPILSISLLGRR